MSPSDCSSDRLLTADILSCKSPSAVIYEITTATVFFETEQFTEPLDKIYMLKKKLFCVEYDFWCIRLLWLI